MIIFCKLICFIHIKWAFHCVSCLYSIFVIVVSAVYKITIQKENQILTRNCHLRYFPYSFWTNTCIILHLKCTQVSV